jgi:phosphoinositide-3-kinase, regulatory subunit 4
LVHPSADIRLFAVATINAFSHSLGHPDAEVFLAPILRPFLRFQPSFGHLTSKDGLGKCLKPSWTRQRFNQELESIQSASLLSPTSGQWTSVGMQVRDGTAKIQVEDRVDREESVDQQTQQVRLYLTLLARSRAHHMQMDKDFVSLRTHLNHCIEGSLKLSQQIKFPKQTVPGLPGSSIPPWYETLRLAAPGIDGVSESVAIRSVSAIGQIYGLSIMDQEAAKIAPPLDLTSEQTTRLLASEESLQIEAASGGQWGSETCLDPTLSDTSLLVAKLTALRVPPLPPRLVAEEKQGSTKTGSSSKGATREQPVGSVEWKLKIDTMVASSKCTPEHGHTAPVVRLVVSHDQRFFTTGSHDSTCRIWELEKAERSNGILESSTVYTGHQNAGSTTPRINDLAMVEGGHSLISGASDGAVHVWRVDLVSSTMLGQGDGREVSRVVGSSEIRRVSSDEGEILAVNHFNTSSASILTYATQRGFLHSWDLRAALEPFSLKLPQDTGYVTSMAMGNDRNWVVLGTNRGFISLWDLRFQQILKLWRHSRASPVNRLATSFVPPPQSWIGRGGANSEARPFVFAACGPNECGMFDLSTGACRECFRTVDYGSRFSKSRLDDMPSLQEMPLSLSTRRNMLLSKGVRPGLHDTVSSSYRSVNAMVGSIGASDQSFLITGGSDCRIRYWDFAMPSKCYVSAGPETVQPRPTFERIDYNQSSRLMLCRQPPTPTLREVDGSKIPRKVLQGAKKLEKVHDDAITDLKMFRSGLLSCSRDCTVKLWR